MDIPDSRGKRGVPPSKNAGLKVRQITAVTPIYIKNNALAVIVKSMQRKWTKSGFRAVQAVTYDNTPTSGKPHVVTIIGQDVQYAKGMRKADVPPVIKQRLLIDCDCDNHLFYWEYALYHHGSAKIRRSNGQPPSVTNPGLVPGCCKHVYAVLKEMAKAVY
jgi:hypothetical protein